MLSSAGDDDGEGGAPSPNSTLNGPFGASAGGILNVIADDPGPTVAEREVIFIF